MGHEGGTLLKIPAPKFRQSALANPEMLIAMLAVVGRRLYQSDIQRLSYVSQDVPYRTASTLLQWAAQYGVETQEGIRIQLRTSRRELSQVVAASEKSVDDVLTILRRAGLVVTARRLFVVTDVAGLRRWLSERAR
ncbi:hypothetical protein GCM10022223_20090 [Kineosporia mesophila]|uniref:HTH crp-type domain-containing protein n=1 Tax=Kineosporia mesophila TaxID=566012 RepID=A0ABP6ZFE7_9ACTN